MTLHASRQEELKQLVMFRDKVNSDRRVNFNLKIRKEAIDYSSLFLEFTGLTTLVVDSSHTGYRKHTGPITAHMSIPAGHAAQTVVRVTFRSPFPFHPHVSTSGWICWGTVGNDLSADWTLVMWTMAVLEYLQLNQNTFIGVNPRSPANSKANAWYQQNRNRLSREISPIDLAYVRQLSYQVG